MMLNSYIIVPPAPFDVTIGSGTINQPEYPMYMFYDYGYFAFIYKNSEINLSSTVNITGIRFQMKETGGTESMTNQTLKLGQVNQALFDINIRNDMTQSPLQPTPWLTNNLMTVKSNFTWTVNNNPPTWTEVLFSTPYLYNPNDTTYPHLLIVWKNNDGSYNSGSSTPYSECFSDGTARSYYDYQDNSMPPSTAYGTRDSTGTPNIQLICSY
jgi:hypothetical protein